MSYMKFLTFEMVYMFLKLCASEGKVWWPGMSTQAMSTLNQDCSARRQARGWAGVKSPWKRKPATFKVPDTIVLSPSQAPHRFASPLEHNLYHQGTISIPFSTRNLFCIIFQIPHLFPPPIQMEQMRYTHHIEFQRLANPQPKPAYPPHT